MRAETQALLRYRAPDTKEFKIISERGSGLIRSRVFKPLMDVEVETAAERNRIDSSITPNNYTLSLLGEEEMGGSHCFVVQATPKRADTYLFEGKIWIHSVEFAIVQIEGQPAKSPSVWIKRVDFVRRYQKIGEFWLPLKNESITRVRFFGKNTLTTDYDNYEINQVAIADRVDLLPCQLQIEELQPLALPVERRTPYRRHDALHAREMLFAFEYSRSSHHRVGSFGSVMRTRPWSSI